MSSPIIPDGPLTAPETTSHEAPESRYDAEVRLLIAAVLESRRAYRLAVSLAKDVMVSSHVESEASVRATRARLQPTPIRFSALVPSRTLPTSLRLVRAGEMATVSMIDTTSDGDERA